MQTLSARNTAPRFRWWIVFIWTLYAAGAIALATYLFDEIGVLPAAITKIAAGGDPMIPLRLLVCICGAILLSPLLLARLFVWIAPGSAALSFVEGALFEIVRSAWSAFVAGTPTFKGIVAVGSIPLLATASISGTLAFCARLHPPVETTTNIDLDGAAPISAVPTRFARIRGKITPQFAFTRKRGNGTAIDIVVPITGTQSATSQTIRYFVRFSPGAAEVEAGGTLQIASRIGRPLDRYVFETYRKKGFLVDPDYVVLDRIEPGEIPAQHSAVDYEPAWMVLEAGVWITAFAWLCLAITMAAIRLPWRSLPG